MFKDQIIRALAGPWASLAELHRRHWDVAAHRAEYATDSDFPLVRCYLEIICHGPWKHGRINSIAAKVFKAFPDIKALEAAYPLGWQKTHLLQFYALFRSNWQEAEDCFQQFNFEKFRLSSQVFSKELKLTISDILLAAIHIVGMPKRSKVRDIFLGRYLGIPSFPIDRHIDRALYSAGIKGVGYSNPSKYNAFLVDLEELGYDPILFEYHLIGLSKKLPITPG